ncbi:hypothetical protein Micbo1qcDRAFT_16704 [Microdochium bolleyi]|uniref:Uncharacterized protein n=1 Tax=Microdochium bolleyi TaxID=196109 RepID=A0A136IVY4_9PEZI|nr:hypothetical protein Micbo1qcDRAFT_16704 [Microdochium bolleyi]
MHAAEHHGHPPTPPPLEIVQEYNVRQALDRAGVFPRGSAPGSVRVLEAQACVVEPSQYPAICQSGNSSHTSNKALQCTKCGIRMPGHNIKARRYERPDLPWSLQSLLDNTSVPLRYVPYLESSSSYACRCAVKHIPRPYQTDGQHTLTCTHAHAHAHTHAPLPSFHLPTANPRGRRRQLVQ